MDNITIGIVTFKERSELVKKLIEQIRKSDASNTDIILIVNGNNEEDMPDSYRQEMLDLSKNYKNVYPIICPEFKSLPKLWNTITIFSKTDYNFIIGDDVAYDNPDILKIIKKYVDETGSEFFTINNQFSHFVLTKNILHKLGYFDERLCAFGEEDGDMVYRHIEMFGNRMQDLYIHGLYNKASYNLSSKKLETHTDNKPRFNREFSMLKYNPDPNGIRGMSPIPVKKVIDDYQQYPYEQFVRNNKHNIFKYVKVILED